MIFIKGKWNLRIDRMISENQSGWIFIIVILLTLEIEICAMSAKTPADQALKDMSIKYINGSIESGNRSQMLARLNKDLQSSITKDDTASSRLLVNSILGILNSTEPDSLILSDSQYYLGVYYLLAGQNDKSAKLLKSSFNIRDRLHHHDELFVKCLSNLGIAFCNLGDFINMKIVNLYAYEIGKKIYGDNSPELSRELSGLVAAYFGLNDYDVAICYGDSALNLIKKTKTYSLTEDMATLYTNIGICHARLSDYSKASLYLEKAESVYFQGSLKKDEQYINLLNSLAATYYYLGLQDKSDECFKKGLNLTKSSFSNISLNFINSYATILGNSGRIKEGNFLMASLLERARNHLGSDSHNYIEVLRNYAEYLRIFKIDIKKSLLLYNECTAYINKHGEELSLKDVIMLGYALTLSVNGESKTALENIQKLLYSATTGESAYPASGNPGIDRIKPDQWTMNILKVKYRILWDVYRVTQDYKYLEDAAITSELIVALIEKLRINISEEESRLILGDSYRDSYVSAIRDYDLCYKKTGNQAMWEKAFEYSEKSKVAGLLASTRELKATQFHIPVEIADLEMKIKTDIGSYYAMISDEEKKKSPDPTLISEWKGNVFTASQKRDSLIRMFEKRYPDYYQIKYNTQVIKPEDVPELAGRNINYLSYVVTDSVMYIFLLNRKYRQIITVPVDTFFFNKIREFRTLLSTPSLLNNAKSDFERFQEIGVSLYNSIFEPVRQYLISGQLLISPDNILSYIPFEAIPVARVSSGTIMYKNLPYLMNYFRISYTYSATFLAEISRRDNNPSNSLIAFAPLYTGIIYPDSLLKMRQARLSNLHDLPYARNEAEYVAKITGGKLFENDRATESVYRSEAGNYNIVHLAMHTVLNDQSPMYSKMIFYQGKNSSDDGFLNTYEVYGIPLKAKMVFLSSCNTGTGILHSGEGILSLARGFMYSGSQSVIMSMWEVEDRSGTDIVEYFYRYLKSGETKSNALRKARLKYLKKSDMLRSHPYFWSSLVIYGNNAPLYHSRQLLILNGAILLLILTILLLYRHKTK